MNEPNSYARVTLKRSSSSGKLGADIEVVNAGISKKLLLKRMEIALQLALKAEQELNQHR